MMLGERQGRCKLYHVTSPCCILQPMYRVGCKLRAAVVVMVTTPVKLRVRLRPICEQNIP